jgi:hypothetical protein
MSIPKECEQKCKLVHVVAEPEQLAQGDVQEAQAEPFQKVPEAHGLHVDPERV